MLPWSEAAISLRQRAGFAGILALTDAALKESLQDWLPPLLVGRRRLSDMDRSALFGVLEGILGWDGKQAVDRLAPPDFVSPAGSHHAIDYAAEGGPRITLRVQALYGLAEHPCVGSNRIHSFCRSHRLQDDRSRPRVTSGVLGRKLERSGERNAWPLSPSSLA